MRDALPRARLYLIGGATLVFLGGLLVAIGHWNRAEVDRAFVEAAAQAARSSSSGDGVRYWTPAVGGTPGGTIRLQLNAEDRLREIRSNLPPSIPPSPSAPIKAPVPR